MKLALGLSKRAESYDLSHLENSFVEVGNIPTLLTNNDSAVIFGRRGTGKTHLLSYIARQVLKDGGIACSVDMRRIGSSSGLYADFGVALSERATRLLKDTANTIHESLIEAYTSSSPSDFKFGEDLISALDNFLDTANSIYIEGAITREQAQNFQAGHTLNSEITGNFGKDTNATLKFGGSEKFDVSQSDKETQSGTSALRINFGNIANAFSRVVKNLPNGRLWLLIDEWSEVPPDLQPYLADMLRRGFLAVSGVTAKIAAIEHRTSLRFVRESTNHSVGIEIGADVAMSLNLDDHMVFENDSTTSSQFFSDMLFRHMKTLAVGRKTDFEISSASELTRLMFTQDNSFNEFVRASEGVPRDAINILSKCALKANTEKISMQVVRDAARAWYTTSKQNDVSSRPRALELLDWIKKEVIGKRRARGFLLDVRVKDELIDFLFDSRVLHIIKKGISSKDRDDEGKKYNAWVLDYGCYAELANTKSAPKGLFEAEEDEATAVTKYVDVPQTDYRSLRRAVLDLSDFYAAVKK